MAALNSLDLKDADGMTALLHAAKHNHHLMVADLILLGANVNETNTSGKTCLHLSAERGYIRVLEVLKNKMMEGVYIDVEATDNSGICVLQCASLALKATVRKLESSKFPNQTRLYTLRQEQIMETLECLLQMGSYLHTMCMQPRSG
ncbi:NF-kappa-B inhibitor zeta-like isoform X1 [Anarrhichthys ocellatus]|uniref:NF-kappa-B inhibitor zeta-like isoform X1 n=1 Tax=Anarrhichthys ocellatus TaxID=433405 RepID=UPI0012EDE520|nr:NF-kappa-B inhibitor zeta-like isoform X1 [Anarrhichthys ocellatus]